MIYHLFLRRLFGGGYLRQGVRMISHALRDETTTSELSRLFSLTFNLKFGLLHSVNTAFSFDIDHPADLELLSIKDRILDVNNPLGIMDYSQG
jgi:hypothetical protein